MKVAVSVKCKAEWTEARTYDLGDCKTRREMELALDQRVGDDHFEGVVDVELEFDVTADPSGVWGRPPEPIPWADPVREDCWVTVDGHRWMSDGACCLREDSPRPEFFGDNHGFVCGEALASFRSFLDLEGRAPWPGRQAFHARFAPVLKAGAVSAVDYSSMYVVRRNGETIAIVMAMRENGTIGLDGEPLEGGTQ